MTDQEINIALAKAIGWQEKDIWVTERSVLLAVRCNSPWAEWTAFDYRDPAVIWPISKRWGLAFPSLRPAYADWYCHCGVSTAYANEPELAVALAVIGAKE